MNLLKYKVKLITLLYYFSVVEHSANLVDALYAAMLTLDVVQSRHLALVLGLLVLHLAEAHLA